MRLTKLGHACLLVEVGDARLLIDPGTFSHGFEALRGLTGILVTHQHGDHLDPARIQAVAEANPDAALVADVASAELLVGLGLRARPVGAGDVLDVGVPVRVLGRDHAVVHPDIPVVPNVGFLIDARLLHPGDALTVPAEPVEVLALPTMAPWMGVAAAVDFLRAVRPEVAVPIHDALLRDPRFYHRFFNQLGPAGTRLAPLDDGEACSV